MIKLFKAIIIALIRLWSKVYSYKTSLWFRNKRNTLYTLWLGNFLGKIGNESRIQYPCKLTGGGNISI